jgi:hypothetical protein
VTYRQSGQVHYNEFFIIADQRGDFEVDLHRPRESGHQTIIEFWFRATYFARIPHASPAKGYKKGQNRSRPPDAIMSGREMPIHGVTTAHVNQ